MKWQFKAAEKHVNQSSTSTEISKEESLLEQENQVHQGSDYHIYV